MSDPETIFHIQQTFADLGMKPAGEAVPPPPLTREVVARDVRAAFAELDLRQLDISRRLTPAQRFRQVCDLNRFLRHATIAAIRQQHPGINEADLQKELLRRRGIHAQGT